MPPRFSAVDRIRRGGGGGTACGAVEKDVDAKPTGVLSHPVRDGRIAQRQHLDALGAERFQLRENLAVPAEPENARRAQAEREQGRADSQRAGDPVDSEPAAAADLRQRSAAKDVPR